MKIFNVVTKKTYTKDGQEKTQWNTVGKLVKFDATADKPEGYKLELYMQPDTDFMVFEQKPREQAAPQNNDPVMPDYPAEEIDESSIPF